MASVLHPAPPPCWHLPCLQVILKAAAAILPPLPYSMVPHSPAFPPSRALCASSSAEEDLDDGAVSYQCDACRSRTRAYKSVKFEARGAPAARRRLPAGAAAC